VSYVSDGNRDCRRPWSTRRRLGQFRPVPSACCPTESSDQEKFQAECVDIVRTDLEKLCRFCNIAMTE
jgi:hypothetical protein